MLNHLVKLAAEAPGPMGFRVNFDGRMLTVDAGGQILGAPAIGAAAWPEPVRAVLATDNRLPKRLLTEPVEVGVWDGALEVERARMPLVPW